jgi:hypothetical protein
LFVCGREGAVPPMRIETPLEMGPAPLL